MPAPGSGYSERVRVSALLDRALDDKVRLALLSAPPGYGKTIALAGWLQSRGLPCAWLSLDAADNDLARFARYLGAALGSVRPEAEAATLGLVGPGSNATSDLIGAVLVDAMAATDEPFVLVFDDYHVVTAEPVRRLVRFLVEHGPPFVHLVLVTREDPPVPLARLRAHGRLVELRADDLRYSVDEASAYLADAGLVVATDLVARLVEQTEGWIAGLQLAAISLRDRPDAAALVEAFSGSQRFVLDYLADEVLERIDDDLRSFLVHTSIGERFDVGLCRELSGRDDADALLTRAELANLFLVPLDTERRWYRYHHLFADYLRAQLGEDERRALHERAADYLEAHGLGPEAIDHALAGGSLDRAVGLIEREAVATFEAGELATLLGWLDALPDDRVAASGELVSLRGWALFLTGQVAAARACADSPIAPGIAGSAEGRLYALRVVLDPFFPSERGADDLAGASLELLGADDPVRALTLLALGTTRLSRGEFVAAIETLRLALASARRTGQSMTAAAAATVLGLALVATGSRSEAEVLARELLEDRRAPGSPAGAAAWFVVHWLLGIARYEAGDPPEARAELERGYAAAARFGLDRTFGLGVPDAYLALARQATASPEAALETVRAVARDARAAGATRVAAQAAETEARIRLMQGDLAAAATWAEQEPAHVGGGVADSGRQVRDLTIARVRLAQSRPAEARGQLAAARGAAEAVNSVAELITIGILDAAVADATGRRAAARRSLEAAVRLAGPGGYVQRFVDDGRSVAHLLPLVRKASPTFVDRVTTAVDDAVGPRRARARVGHAVWQDAAGQLLEPLTARELDVLRLMAEGATNADIARRLAVSVGTAKWHVGNVRAKLGVSNRTQALVRAQELGLV
jgi:LuxR family maltose regulon positive regulatory protein